MNSLRAKGVMSFQASSAAGHDYRARPATHAMLSKTGAADLMLARVDAPADSESGRAHDREPPAGTVRPMTATIPAAASAKTPSRT